METIGHRLKNRRKAAGLTQGELGAAAGVSKQAISAIESGATQSPEAKTVEPIARRLGVSTRWLLTGRGDPNETDAPSAQDGSPISQSQRLTIRRVMDAAQVVADFRRRRGATVDLTTEGDAELFMAVLEQLDRIEGQPSTSDQIELGAKIAELAAAREARNGREAKGPVAGLPGKTVRRKAAG
ncbi:helix-turn-helix transcriptional regulator [Lysobacter sp. ESA13C]|uniref:helix-turn-helix domain-containing protein n=1 Tax=Lysobacter sp. ESA13C TaxID=2862676 RepID=UPI001CBE8111|nr:helix-turn-helix transcriptional regulator [Lysobacter sp. ESA13C]